MLLHREHVEDESTRTPMIDTRTPTHTQIPKTEFTSQANGSSAPISTSTQMPEGQFAFQSTWPQNWQAWPAQPTIALASRRHDSWPRSLPGKGKSMRKTGQSPSSAPCSTMRNYIYQHILLAAASQSSQRSSFLVYGTCSGSQNNHDCTPAAHVEAASPELPGVKSSS